jgi:hypothetical protein
MPYAFLSEEWMTEARLIRERHGPRDTEVPPVSMNLVITGVPFGEGTVRSYVDTRSGNASIELGELDDADVSLTTDYETARVMFVMQDPAAAMQAFLSGKVMVQGDMMKLMSLNASMSADPEAAEIAEQIKAITD